MLYPPLLPFGILLFTLLAVTLHLLAASGHFPREERREVLRTAGGDALIWGSMALSVLALCVCVALSWRSIPWYAGVIGGGGVVLAAPLVLQAMPDSFVDGRRGLLALAFAAVAGAVALWAVTG